MDEEILDLREFQERLSSREALKKEWELLSQRQSELSLRIKQEKINLDYERSDVEDLERNSLKSFFYSAIGKKEEKRMQEEDEVDEAERKYEASKKELQEVEGELRRVELALKRLERAERDYQRLAKSLPARLEAVRPLLSGADAINAEIIYREMQEQEQRLALYGEIIEEGERLADLILFVNEALCEMIHESREGTYIDEREARREAQERKKLVEIQAKRFQACLAKGVQFSNSYTIDVESVDNTIRRAILATNEHSAPNEDMFLSDIPDIGLNLRGILDETEKKIERSRRHRADLDARLSELLKKYEV